MPRFALPAVMLLAVAAPVFAGIYDPSESCPFTVAADGTATPLPFPQFKAMLVERTDDRNPATPDTADGRTTHRGRLKEQLAALPPNTRTATADALAARTALLLRLHVTDGANGAVALLEPRTRDRELDFRLLSHLAMAYAARDEWDLAARRFGDAADFFDEDHPPPIPGAKPEQAKWLLKVDREYTPRWLRTRMKAGTDRAALSETDPYPLFAGKDRSPVKFVGDSGKYEAGTLAKAERAKLPPDAVAIAQQLALWAPYDGGLLWELAELYAADGKLREANELMEMMVGGRAMTGWKHLMDHRRSIADAVAKLPPPVADAVDLGTEVGTSAPVPADIPAPGLFAGVPTWQLWAGGVAFAAFAIGLMALQGWAIAKRVRTRGAARRR